MPLLRHARHHARQFPAHQPRLPRLFLGAFLIARTPANGVCVLPPDRRGSTGMLRIVTTRRGTTYRLDLHGTIAGEWIDVLERHWREVVANAPLATVAVGLSNVVFIDRDGEELVRRMAECGVTFDGAGCMNRYVIRKISGGV